MTEDERRLSQLTKDVAVMATIQKKTSENVDKLTSSVEVLIRESIKLENRLINSAMIEKDVELLKKNQSRGIWIVAALLITYAVKVVLEH